MWRREAVLATDEAEAENDASVLAELRSSVSVMEESEGEGPRGESAEARDADAQDAEKALLEKIESATKDEEAANENGA